MFGQVRSAVLMLIAFTVLMGVAYPLAVTGIAQLAFADPANGSLIVRNGRTVGSELIGQPFDDPKYFWGRPSATGPYPYNAGSSSGGNLAIGTPAQLDAIKSRVEKLRAADSGNDAPVPIDLVTASASGLDPHISPDAARYQAGRVARIRVLDAARVNALIDAATEPPQFGILGEPRVNVLRLNLSLEDLAGAQP
jgi:K+-transporting ATPase ATPase C chain